MLGGVAHHGVAFPVSDGFTGFDFDRPFGDVGLAEKHAPRGSGAIFLASHLGEDAGESMERATMALVLAKTPVDGLDAGHGHALRPVEADDLVGAPALFQCRFDEAVDGFGEAWPSPTSSSPGHRIAVGLLGPVAVVVGGGVAADLSGDGAGGPAE